MWNGNEFYGLEDYFLLFLILCCTKRVRIICFSALEQWEEREKRISKESKIKLNIIVIEM